MGSDFALPMLKLVHYTINVLTEVCNLEQQLLKSIYRRVNVSLYIIYVYHLFHLSILKYPKYDRIHLSLIHLFSHLWSLDPYQIQIIIRLSDIRCFFLFFFSQEVPVRLWFSTRTAMLQDDTISSSTRSPTGPRRSTESSGPGPINCT